MSTSLPPPEPLPAPPPFPGAPPPAQPGGGPFSSGETGPLVCRVCGQQPAVHVDFQQNIGLLFLRQARSWTGDACRDCGRSVGRRLTNLTLVTGWTGMISFIMNVAAVAKNTAALRKLGALAPATRPPGAPDPGRSVFLRPGIWALAAVVGAIGVTVAMQKPDPTWAIGACVKVDGSKARPTDCGGAHDGTIIAVVSDSAPCPLRSKGHVISGSKRYCVG